MTRAERPLGSNVEGPQEFFLCECNLPCCLHVKLLPAQDIDEFHLLLECDHQFLLLSLKLLVLCSAATSSCQGGANGRKRQRAER